MEIDLGASATVGGLRRAAERLIRLGGADDLNPITREFLSERLGVEVHEIEPESITSGGHHSRIYACKSEIGDLIVRVSKGAQGWWTSYFPDRVDPHKWVDQAWANARAQEAGVPAPEVLYSDRAQRWTVSRRLPGIPVDDRYENWRGCPYDEKHFGILLRRLHSIRPFGWGPIDDFGSGLFDTWPSFLVAAARSAIKTASSRGALPPDLTGRLEAHWVPRLAEVHCRTVSLLHMESLGFANLLYDPDTREITGLLDYEDCIGGDPLIEFAFMRFYFEHDDRRQDQFNFGRFRMGYGSFENPHQGMAIYLPFPYLDKLRWIDPESERASSYRRWLEEHLNAALFS